MGAFPRDQVDKLLVDCHRRCCICHRFCGVKIETDHIVQAADGGSDTIDNAIPVCFECHAEIHSYNEKHPRGRKFRPEELRGHKEQWLDICRQRPEALINAAREIDVGPLQALVDELDFNLSVAAETSLSAWGCQFHDEQFRRAIRAGSIAVLQDTLKEKILKAYVVMGEANYKLHSAMHIAVGSSARGNAAQKAAQRVIDAKDSILAARKALEEFLGSDDQPS